MYPYGFYKPQGRLGGLNSVFKNFSFNGFLDGCGKTLNVINQAIPVVQQIGPVVANAKTMFKIANIMNDNEPVRETNISNVSNNANKPIFYV